MMNNRPVQNAQHTTIRYDYKHVSPIWNFVGFELAKVCMEICKKTSCQFVLPQDTSRVTTVIPPSRCLLSCCHGFLQISQIDSAIPFVIFVFKLSSQNSFRNSFLVFSPGWIHELVQEFFYKFLDRFISGLRQGSLLGLVQIYHPGFLCYR